MKIVILILIIIIFCTPQSVLGKSGDTILIQNAGPTDRLIICLMFTKSTQDEIKERELDSLSQLEYIACNELKLENKNFNIFQKLCTQNKFVSIKNRSYHSYGTYIITIKKAGSKDRNIYLFGDKSVQFFKWLSNRLAQNKFNQNVVILFSKKAEMIEINKK